jgi:hypothetical protein
MAEQTETDAERHDYDQTFKKSLQLCLHDFLRFAVPKIAPHLDAERAQWLEKEIFVDPPKGSRRHADLVAKLPVKESTELSLVLVHIEIESADSATDIRRRMFDYYYGLYREYQLHIVPIVLFLNMSQGIDTDEWAHECFGRKYATITYHTVGLRGLDGLQYSKSDNILEVALSALMSVPKDKVVEVALNAVRTIGNKQNLTDVHQLYLMEMVHIGTPFSEADKRVFEETIKTDAELKKMNRSPFYAARQEGRLEGEAKGEALGSIRGRRELLREQLEEKFGELTADVLARLEALSADDLKSLARKVIRANSLAELGLAD